MIPRAGRPLVALAAAAVLAACGGGGSSANSSLPAAAPQSPSLKAAPNGRAQLTIAFPTEIGVAQSTAQKRAQIALRNPAYVNPNPASPSPGTGNLMDIYVDGVLQTNLDGSGIAGHSLYIAYTPDGTQSASIPIYSSATNQIVAIEYDNTGAVIYAIGEKDLGTFTPGATLPVSLTMLMNATNIAVTTSSTGSSASLVSSIPSSPTSLGYGCSSSISGAFYFFETDASGTFVPIAGYGGTALPSITATSVTPSTGTTKVVQSTVGSYFVSYDGSGDPITLTLAAPNPAFAVFGNADPGIASLSSTLPLTTQILPSNLSGTLTLQPGC